MARRGARVRPLASDPLLPSEPAAFTAITPAGERTSVVRIVAEETPVAIEVNGIGYAVLMATGADLEDLAFGFALSERLIETGSQILDVDAHRTQAGIMLRVTLSADRAERVRDRVRHRASDSSCGLCGIENLEQAMRPLPALPPAKPVSHHAVFAALGALRGHQPLNARTGAVHAAALCGEDGAILLVREDVGRHNAFDKLIGAMIRRGLAWGDGFALLSSRCSYELVEKAVLSGCPTLAVISPPTNLALQRARDAGLAIIAVARPDGYLVADQAG